MINKILLLVFISQLFIPSISQAQTCDIDLYLNQIYTDLQDLNEIQSDPEPYLSTLDKTLVKSSTENELKTLWFEGILKEVFVLTDDYSKETSCDDLEIIRLDFLNYLDKFTNFLMIAYVSANRELNMDNFLRPMLEEYEQSLNRFNAHFEDFVPETEK